MSTSEHKKILIVHDWLNVKDGGAEAVLYELLAMFPDADLATLVYEPSIFASKIGSRQVRASWLQHAPRWLKQRPHLLLPFIRRAVQSISTQGYDLVIASSSAYVKNIPLQKDQECLIYCYSPGRMLWDSWPAAMNKRTNSPVARFFITRWVSQLRLWDYYESQSPRRHFVAISQTIADRITKFYHRRSRVIYPPVDQPPTPVVERGDYYVIVSVLAEYKQIDLAIAACRDLKRKLIIVGDGPDRERLEGLAAGDDRIVFAGRVSDGTKHKLLAAARGFIFCSIEDFGIAPVEAMACGTPVVARSGGGLSETVVADRTGVFFDEPTAESLAKAIKRLEGKTWSAAAIRRQAAQFAPEKFRQDFRRAVRQVMK